MSSPNSTHSPSGSSYSQDIEVTSLNHMLSQDNNWSRYYRSSGNRWNRYAFPTSLHQLYYPARYFPMPAIPVMPTPVSYQDYYMKTLNVTPHEYHNMQFTTRFQTFPPSYILQRQMYERALNSHLTSQITLDMSRYDESYARSRISDDQMSQLIEKIRKWSMTNEGRKTKYTSPNKKDCKSIEFTLMSYNILAQQLLNDHPYLYIKCDSNSLQWSERVKRILRELQACRADVLCLQEVQEDHFHADLLPQMRQLGYEAIFTKKTGNKVDGCAIFYNSSKFILDECVPVALMRKDISSVLNRDNIALIAVFKPVNVTCNKKDEEMKLIVATTHLLFNPKRGEVKLAQLRLLLAEIDRIGRKSNSPGDKPEYHPIILCGDMNSEPNSLLYRFITEGTVNMTNQRLTSVSGQREGYDGLKLSPGSLVTRSHLRMKGIAKDSTHRKELDKSRRQIQVINLFDSDSDSSETVDKIANLSIDEQQEEDEYADRTISHNFKFRSAYKLDANFVSTINSQTCCLVDYIFFHDSSHLTLLGVIDLLSEEQMNNIGTLPNAHIGSDHLSLVAKFKLNLE